MFRGNEEEPWRVQKDYQPGLYIFLLQNLEEIKELAAGDFSSNYRRNVEMLRMLGIKKVSLGKTKVAVGQAARYNVMKGVQQALEDAKKYISEHYDLYRESEMRGELDLVLRKQGELEFKASEVIGDPMAGRGSGVTREDGLWRNWS